MIKLKKDITTDVALTLTEKVTIVSPIYIFSFVHDLTFEVVNFILPDVSPYPERYNLFQINETTLDLKKGFHCYTIYEAEVDSPQDTDPNNYSPSLNVLEVGKVYVWETEIDLPTFDTGVTTEIPTFTP
jgi:hypothetical protein